MSDQVRLSSLSTFPRLLMHHAQARPNHPATREKDMGIWQTWTWSQVAEEVRAMASGLAELGFKRGDNLAIIGDNRPRLYWAMYAAQCLGGVPVPMYQDAVAAEMIFVLQDAGIKFAIVEDQEQVDKLLENKAQCPALQHILYDDPRGLRHYNQPFLHGLDEVQEMGRIHNRNHPEFLDAEIELGKSDDIAVMLYTSGTTGKPKGALLTHANLIAGARAVAGWHGLGPADRVLSSLPIYHINGQVIATTNTFVSGGSLIAPKKFHVSEWWKMAEKFEATWINMVPTIIAYLLNAAEPGKTYRFPKVRFGRSASAPLPPEHHVAFEQVFGISVIECMGMTETSSVAFANPQDPAKRKIGSLGKPCGIEARVVDGELQLRGPNVMRGYYKSPEQTQSSFTPDGWLLTGDLGREDEDGYFYITGRKKELIIKGGENIAPREIDEALLKHPAVLEAAAVGVPDREYGQEILACIVVKPGFELGRDEVDAHCLRELGRYKAPRHVRFVEALPKGPSGKVQRMALAREFDG